MRGSAVEGHEGVARREVRAGRDPVRHGDVLGLLLQDDHRHDGVAARGLDGRDVVGDHDVARGHLVALLRAEREPLAFELDGVDAEVDQDADTIGGQDHLRVREGLEQLPADRCDRVDDGAWRVDRRAGPDDRLGEGRIRNVAEAHAAASDGREDHHWWDGVHRRSSMSSARFSASGPTTTWMMVPDWKTPYEPAAVRAFSSTSEGSRTSVRSRVMHASISTTFPAPPRAARICSCLLLI